MPIQHKMAHTKHCVYLQVSHEEEITY